MTSDTNTGKLSIEVKPGKLIATRETRTVVGHATDGLPVRVSIAQDIADTPNTFLSKPYRYISVHVPATDGYDYYISAGNTAPNDEHQKNCIGVGSTHKEANQEPSQLLKTTKPEVYVAWQKAAQQFGTADTLATKDAISQAVGGNPNDSMAHAYVCEAGARAKLTFAALPVLRGVSGDTLAPKDFDELAAIARNALQSVGITPKIPSAAVQK